MKTWLGTCPELLQLFRLTSKAYEEASVQAAQSEDPRLKDIRKQLRSVMVMLNGEDPK